MKIKNLFTILNLIFLIFISGCGSISTQNKQDVDVHVGYKGLAIEFVKNTPPPRIFEGDTFPVYLKIKNNGAYSIKDSKAIVNLGVEKDYTLQVVLLEGSRIQKAEGKAQKEKSEEAALFLQKLKAASEKEVALTKTKRAREIAEREALAGRIKK